MALVIVIIFFIAKTRKRWMKIEQAVLPTLAIDNF